MESGIRLTMVWSDRDMWEVRASARNSQFSGVARFYEQRGDFIALAAGLEGFPVQERLSDDREFELGFVGIDRTFGGMKLKFYSKGLARRAFVEVVLDSNKNDSGQVQSVLVRGAVEAAGIDRFVSELRTIEDGLGGDAFLRMEESDDQ